MSTSVIQTFAIQNIGNQDLTVSDLQVPTGFSLVGDFPSSITSGNTTSFQIQLDADTEGEFSGELSFTTNDTDENPFTLIIQGMVTSTPEIHLTGNDTVIEDGSTAVSTDNHTDFGVLEPESTPVIRTFTIHNQGNGDLLLSGNPIVQITGSTDFTISTQPLSTIAQGSETAFQITFNPSTEGIKTATVTIENNDGNEGSFSFTIFGEVTVATALPEQLSVGKITIAPNPSSEWMQIEVTGNTARVAQVYISDAQGKQVYNDEPLWEENSLAINISTLKPGTYTLVIQLGNQSIARKIIKK